MSVGKKGAQVQSTAIQRTKQTLDSGSMQDEPLLPNRQARSPSISSPFWIRRSAAETFLPPPALAFPPLPTPVIEMPPAAGAGAGDADDAAAAAVPLDELAELADAAVAAAAGAGAGAAAAALLNLNILDVLIVRVGLGQPMLQSQVNWQVETVLVLCLLAPTAPPTLSATKSRETKSIKASPHQRSPAYLIFAMAFANSRLEKYHSTGVNSKTRSTERRLRRCVERMRATRSRLLHQARMNQPAAVAQVRRELRSALADSSVSSAAHSAPLQSSSSLSSATVATEPGVGDDDGAATSEAGVELLIAQCLADLDIELQHREQQLLQQYEEQVRFEAEELNYLASLADQTPALRPSSSTFGTAKPASAAVEHHGMEESAMHPVGWGAFAGASTTAVALPGVATSCVSSSSSSLTASAASSGARVVDAGRSAHVPASAVAGAPAMPSAAAWASSASSTAPSAATSVTAAWPAMQCPGSVLPIPMLCPWCGSAGSMRALGSVVLCAAPPRSLAAVTSHTIIAPASASSSFAGESPLAGSGCGFRFNMSQGLTPAHLPAAIAAALGRHRTASPACTICPPCTVEGGYGASTLVLRCPACRFVDIVA